MLNSPDDYGIPAAGINVKFQRNVSSSHNGLGLYQCGARTWQVHVTTALASCRITFLLSSTTEAKSVQCMRMAATLVPIEIAACVSSLVSHNELLLLVGMPPALTGNFNGLCDTKSDWLVASRSAGQGMEV